MYNLTFRLYKFTYLDENNKSEIMYIISSDWASAFNQLYKAFDNKNMNILSVESLGIEYINMIIDENYIITKTPGIIDPDDYTIIKNVKRYPTENF